MAGHLLRLKLLMVAGGLARGRRGMLVAGLLLAGVLGWSALTVVPHLRSVPPDVGGVLATTVGAGILLGFLVVPPALAVDDPLDPRRFRGLGLDAGFLAASLAVVGVLSLPVATLAVGALLSLGVWSGAASIALLSVGLAVATAVLLARIGMALAAITLADRRRRELVGLGALAVTVALVIPVATFLTGSAADAAETLRPIANVAAWTPFGAAWAAPAEAVVGGTAGGVARVAVAAGWLVILGAVWRASVGVLLSVPDRDPARSASSLGWFGRLPATPLWAVAARSLTYWVRDPRYRVQLAALPLAAALVTVVLAVGGAELRYLALLPLPIACLLLGWSTHNDLAFDSTAFWLHLSAGVRGASDRIGRIVPALVLGGVLIAAGVPLSADAWGDDRVRMPLAAVSACLLLTGLGVSSVFSAAFPYPAVRPGASPFVQPQAAGGSGVGAQGASFFLPLLLSAPSGVQLVRAFLDGGSFEQMSEIALLTGVGTLVVGVAIGSLIVESRGPELLAFTERT